MKSTKDLDWMLKRLYSPKTSDAKIALKNELLDCWNKSVQTNKQSKVPKPVNGYNSLQILYDSYGHFQFMRIVMMTMRVGFNKGFIKQWEEERAFPRADLSGLKSLLDNWGGQENDASRLDHLLEFLGSKNDLCKPEYIIGAILEQVRRIRRGAEPKNNHLEISNGLLKLAQLKWEEYDYKAKEGVDYNVMPNKYLNLLIRYQELLNIGKRGYPIERISGKNISRTDLKKQLDYYLDDLEEADDFYTKDIFRWWAYRSLVRNSIRCMSPEKESADLISKRDEAIKENNADLKARKEEYVAGLRKEGTSLDAYRRQAEMLITYHKALAEFLNNPEEYVTKVKDLRKEGKFLKDELALYRAIKGDSGGLRKSTRLFVDLSNPPVVITEYKGSKSDSCLINYLENSIRNVQMASNIVVSENHYLSVAMQVLLATDLMVRIRWFAGPKKSAEHKGPHAKLTKGTLNEEENLEKADVLRERVVGTLRGIQRNLEFVVSEANKNVQNGPVKLIEHWAEEIEKLKLEKKNTVTIGGDETDLSALGYLCHTCGGFVNWDWKDESPYGSTGREKPDEGDHLELLHKSGNNNHILWISPTKFDEDGVRSFENIYPYVIPLTSGSSS